MTKPKLPKILLTGPTGQVGYELSRSLQPLGEVIPVARNAAEAKGFLGLSSLHLDLCDPDSIRNVIQTIKPSLIVNPAAHTAVDKAESEAELARAINAKAVGIMAEEAKKIGAAMVHYSTDYVFEGSGEKPWKESDPTGPLGVYGQTKLEGEKALAATGIPHIILRTAWVHGVHGANFVKTMLRLGKERETLAVVSDQIGSPTSARAISDATAQILAEARGDIAGFLSEHKGVYHFVCQGETSWYGFAEKIFALARQFDVPLQLKDLKAIRTEDYPTPAKRPKNSRMDCSKLLEHFAILLPHWQTALEASFPAISR